jgi:hypothetical protein
MDLCVYMCIYAHACSYGYRQKVKKFELLQVCVLPPSNVHINHVILVEHHKKATLTLPVLIFFKYLQLKIYICNNKQISFEAENQINKQRNNMIFETLLKKEIWESV